MSWADTKPPIEVPHSLKPLAERLQLILRYWGLDRNLNLVDLYAYDEFGKKYDLVNPPKGHYVSAKDLCTRWGVKAQEFVRGYPARPYLLTHDGSLECLYATVGLIRFPEIAGGNSTPATGEIWYLVPEWWWFKLVHVEFQEKLNIELARKIMPTYKWLTPEEVCSRWRVSLYKLEEYVRDKGLSPYRLNGDEIQDVRPEEWAKPVGPLQVGISFSQCLFRTEDVQAFERELVKQAHDDPNKKELGLDQRGLDRLQVQDQAREFRYHRPDLPRKDVVNLLRDQSPGISYTDETVLKWIKPLFPPQKGGRPRKQRS